MTEAELRVVRILWGALLVSLAIYAAIMAVMARGWEKPSAPFAALLEDPIILALYGAGLVSFAMGWILPAQRLRSARGTAEVRTAWIVRWALFESVAIYGLVAAFVRMDGRLFVLPAIVAVAGFILSFPSRSR